MSIAALAFGLAVTGLFSEKGFQAMTVPVFFVAISIWAFVSHVSLWKAHKDLQKSPYRTAGEGFPFKEKVEGFQIEELKV